MPIVKNENSLQKSLYTLKNVDAKSIYPADFI